MPTKPGSEAGSVSATSDYYLLSVTAPGLPGLGPSQNGRTTWECCVQMACLGCAATTAKSSDTDALVRRREVLLALGMDRLGGIFFMNVLLCDLPGRLSSIGVGPSGAEVPAATQIDRSISSRIAWWTPSPRATCCR
jgi:hypothetical protein